MSDLFDLTDRRVLVTGGGSGIGRAAARGFAARGAKVEVWGRRAASLAETAGGDHGPGSIVTAAVDVSDESAVVGAVQEIVDRWGGLDVVVVNAGVGTEPATIDRSTTESFDRVVATNLAGAFWTVREGAKAMLSREDGAPSGSVVVVSSLAATEGAGRNALYGATKGGVLAMANAAAVDLARHAIRVNTIQPGWIETEMTESLVGRESFETKVIGRVPLGRWGVPEDFVGPLVYLASDASRFQTGTTTVVDGGYAIF